MKKFKLQISIIAVLLTGLILWLLVSHNKFDGDSTLIEVSAIKSQPSDTQKKDVSTDEKAPVKQDAYEEKAPVKQAAYHYRAAGIDSPVEKATQQLTLISDNDIILLKNTLLKKGIYFGTYLAPADVQLRAPRPPDYLTRISKYFNFYTIAATYKVTESQKRGVFTFDAGDKGVEFAIANNAQIKGHVLIANDPLPDWLVKGNFSPDELKDILKTHVQTIVKHYKDKYPGKVSIWNVINEPTCNGGVRTDPDKCLDHGVEKSIWTDIHKPGSTDPTDYIQLAFQWAHEADPNAKLYLNEAGIEQETHPKTERTYQLVKYLKQKGTPINGIGIQAHIRLYDKDKYSTKGLINIMNRFADLGLEVQISEFDVIMAKGAIRVDNATPTTQLAIAVPQQSDFASQAALYKMFFDACLHAKNCTGFTTWGAWDSTSWASARWKGSFYPHLLDGNLKPKLALKYMIDDAKSYKTGSGN
jgi:endo-1,4-beta-xylanase